MCKIAHKYSAKKRHKYNYYANYRNCRRYRLGKIDRSKENCGEFGRKRGGGVATRFVLERQNINFDHPDAFEWSLLAKHVADLRNGKCIEQPIYSYLTCTRQAETIHIEPREVIIIEGILALCDEELRQMMDLKVFVDADADERLIRVIQRDIIERGRTAEDVMKRYVKVLKPMHNQFIEPCKRYADLIVPEGGNNQVAIDILTMYVKKNLK